MEWDLGLRGAGLLLGAALGFGLLAQLLVRRTSRWLWLVAALTYFGWGLLISEWWFGWATEEDLQPNVDGLSWDESLLAIFPSLVAVVLTTRAVRRRRSVSDR